MNRLARIRPEQIAAPVSGAALLALYVVTLAPDVTWWDSGELIAAAHSLGIPHPPGVPLYVILARVFASAFGWLGPAASVNMLSAISMALACAIAAGLIARRTNNAWFGIGAAICAGSMATVWLNATEAEVYAPAMLLGTAMIWSGMRAGESEDRRWLLLTAYLFALAAPLHLTALVAAPAAVLLASWRDGTHFDTDRALLLSGVLIAGAGAGKASASLVVTGVAMIVLHMRLERARDNSLGYKWRVPTGAAALAVAALGVSAILYLPIRASWDPFINQGNPSSVAALLDVLSRNQYDVAPLFPRQAPLWMQIGNWFQYLDWQFALGLAPTVLPNAGRTLVTLLFVALAGAGIAELGRRSARLQWAALCLLLSASAGVVLYLNLKAGPSIGYGVLPDGTPHEVRERDYFFLFSFFTMGLLAGTGAMSVVSRAGRLAAPAGLAIAALPVLLNMPAANRRAEPEASLTIRFARAMLETLPHGAVLYVAGDNDAYPIWYLQSARGLRSDVATVTVPLLGARWYRDELRRRHGLIYTGAERWSGLRSALLEVAQNAAVQGRPLAVAISVAADERHLIADGWALAGFHYRLATAEDGAADSSRGVKLDLPAIERAAAWSELHIARRVRPFFDPVSHHMARILECPHHAIDLSRGSGNEAMLDSSCNFR